MMTLGLLYIFILLGFTFYRNIQDIHKYQQNVYITDRYWRWLTGKHHNFIKDNDFSTVAATFFVILALLIQNHFIQTIFILIALLAFSFSVFVYRFWTKYYATKLKLVFTFRVKRLTVTTFLISLLISLPLALMAYFNSLKALMILAILIATANNIFSFINVLLGGIINIPIEKKIADNFVNEAKRILKENKNLKIIGVTGSYGKTSVKNILGKMLSQNYSTLVTPESYNTLMGVVRTIRERLKPYHQIFVVEMGAYERGEISEICDLVDPEYSIITSIGPQHLESFKTLDNVIMAKGEVFSGLRENGTAFINLADDNILKILLRKDVERITYLEPNVIDDTLLSDLHLPSPYVTAKNIQVTDSGTKVTLRIEEKEGDIYSFDVTTKLLGKHNIENIVACAAVALKLGISPEGINRALYDIEPVKHRLSYSKNALGYTVIDDAFNSNPVGSKNALEALKLFEGNKKFVITPGMIELGSQQYECNYNFGKYIAEAADFAVLVGEKQTEPIFKGLYDSDYDMDNVYVARNIQDGFDKIHTLIREGDVLLIENDLPDIFNEK